MNHRAKYLHQWSFRSKVIVRTDRQTNRQINTQPNDSTSQLQSK